MIQEPFEINPYLSLIAYGQKNRNLIKREHKKLIEFVKNNEERFYELLEEQYFTILEKENKTEVDNNLLKKINSTLK